jgi:hypothetical protein
MPTVHATAPVSLFHTSSEEAVLELDDLVREACAGSESALHVATYQLRARLIFEVTPWLDGTEVDPEDIADDVILEVLEGRVLARERRGESLAAVIRRADALARRRAKLWRKHWNVADE